LDIKKVVNIINKELNTNISSNYYSQIEEWRQWWAGYVKTFHRVMEMQENGRRQGRDLFSLRMAKKICEDWATILLNEKTDITVDNAAANEYLQGENGYSGILKDLNFWQEANTLVEKAFYSGTGAFVLKIDNLTATSSGNVKISSDANIRMEYLPAFCIIPISKKYGKITEAAFVSEHTERGNKYIYLEIHTIENETYIIENRYYADKKGNYSPAPLPEGVVPRFDTGSSVPFFAIVSPNMVNPHKDNLGLGCAIFSEAIDNFKGVDLAFNNFCSDFKLGGKKVFYNRELTKTAGVNSEGQPIYLAPDDMMQQLFVSIGDENLDDNKLIYEFNPSLRVEDNQRGMQSQLDYLSFKCGLGTHYYQFSGTRGASQVTATQYMGEKQELKQNAAKHGISIERALQDIVKAILWVGKNIIGENIDPDAEITVSFADGYVTSDQERRIQDIQDIRDNIMQPWEYRVKWYSEDEETAKAVLADATKKVFGTLGYPTGEDE